MTEPAAAEALRAALAALTPEDWAWFRQQGYDPATEKVADPDPAFGAGSRVMYDNGSHQSAGTVREVDENGAIHVDLDNQIGHLNAGAAMVTSYRYLRPVADAVPGQTS